MRLDVNVGIAPRTSVVKRIFRAFAYCGHNNLLVLNYSRSLLCADCGAVAQRDAKGITSGPFEYGENSLHERTRRAAVWLAIGAGVVTFWYYVIVIIARITLGVN